MAKKKELTPEELEQQADALLAAAEAEEKEDMETQNILQMEGNPILPLLIIF